MVTCRYCGEVLYTAENCDCVTKLGKPESFIIGKAKLINNQLICECGSQSYTNILHINLNNSHIHNYKCIYCGNIVGIQTERSKGDLLL